MNFFNMGNQEFAEMQPMQEMPMGMQPMEMQQMGPMPMGMQPMDMQQMGPMPMQMQQMGPMNQMGMQPMEQPMQTWGEQQIVIIEPYVLEALESVKGKRLVVDTTRGTTSGKLIDVKPDHIVLRELPRDPSTFVRLQQIVSIMVTDK